MDATQHVRLLCGIESIDSIPQPSLREEMPPNHCMSGKVALQGHAHCDCLTLQHGFSLAKRASDSQQGAFSLSGGFHSLLSVVHGRLRSLSSPRFLCGLKMSQCLKKTVPRCGQAHLLSPRSMATLENAQTKRADTQGGKQCGSILWRGKAAQPTSHWGGMPSSSIPNLYSEEI